MYMFSEMEFVIMEGDQVYISQLSRIISRHERRDRGFTEQKIKITKKWKLLLFITLSLEK